MKLIVDAKHIVQYQHLSIHTVACTYSYNWNFTSCATLAASVAGIFSSTMAKHPACSNVCASSTNRCASSSSRALTT